LVIDNCRLNSAFLNPQSAIRNHQSAISLMPDQKITPEQVRQVAVLARLEIPDARISKLTGQLESILEYVAKIGEVDMSGVEPMAHALPLHNVLREDVVGPSLPLDRVLQNAPETDGPFFKVPKVIGGDEDSAG
jgi:aspartyl-tRNA(Asn)/glutamyl-tRNA(Gln) amidotransferase subunit C